MPRDKYITTETFEHMVKNQDVLIGVLNHSITDMKNDFRDFKKGIEEFKQIIVGFVSDFSEVKGSFLTIKRIVWIILTIMGTLAVAGVMAA